jgi:hypothetical protein
MTYLLLSELNKYVIKTTVKKQRLYRHKIQEPLT